jgi:hypothetical protein
MDIISSLLVIVVTVATLFLLYKYGSSIGVSSSSNQLVGPAVDGKKQFDSSVTLPTSINQSQGLTFSYAAWIRVDDFSYRYGQEKVVFIKGPTDLSSMCPGVFLDGNTNALLVKVDTFGIREVVTVPNLSAKKWFHLAIAVDQDSIDVYINGILHTHHSIAQLPRQNPSSVHVGVGGGFDGKVSSLNYYNYFLKESDVTSVMGSPPQQDTSETNAPQPPYYDITWWTGRR